MTNSDSGYTSATSNKNQDYTSLFAASSLKDDLEDFGIDDEDDDEDKEEGSMPNLVSLPFNANLESS